jgi:hypothetical protein
MKAFFSKFRENSHGNTELTQYGNYVHYDRNRSKLSISQILHSGTIIHNLNSYSYHKLNSVAVVRKRTIPTERPLLVGEFSANLCG